MNDCLIFMLGIVSLALLIVSITAYLMTYWIEFKTIILTSFLLTIGFIGLDITYRDHSLTGHTLTNHSIVQQKNK